MARNEQDNLPGCLESIAGQVDAIYLTDTGSTDATVEIARRFGARVRDFEWSDDFSAARNASIHGVAEDWLLTLDADDRLPAGALDQLRNELQSNACVGTLDYRVEERFTPLRAIKFLRNGLGAHFEGIIHEHVFSWLAGRLGEGWVVQDLPSELIHTGYSPETLPRKLARNLPLLRAEWERSKALAEPRLDVGAELGLALAHAGALSEARQFLGSLLNESMANDCPERLELFINLLWVLDQAEGSQARLELARSLEDPLAHSPVYQLHRGLAELAASQFIQARKWLERFRDRDSTTRFEIPIPVEYLGAGLWRELGICFRGEGDLAAAVECFRRCIDLEPANREYQLRLLTCSR
jgi:hypothetical protein